MDVWWRRPSWLAQLSQHWPPNTPPVDVSHPERKSPPITLCPLRFPGNCQILQNTVITGNYFGSQPGSSASLQIALRMEGPSVNMTALEMETARSYWIQAVQGESFATEFKALRENLPLPEASKPSRFNPFLDEELIRLGGRLQFANLSREQRHPLLLDGHQFTKLILHSCSSPSPRATHNPSRTAARIF